MLTGCGTSDSPEELRNDVPPQVLSSLEDYEEIYGFLNDQIRHCHGAGNDQIRSALYTDARARGAVAVHRGQSYSLLGEILESPQGFGSQITVHSRDETAGDQVQGWLQGENGC